MEKMSKFIPIGISLLGMILLMACFTRHLYLSEVRDDIQTALWVAGSFIMLIGVSLTVGEFWCDDK